jgi:penicillin-binding protein 2
MNKFIRNKKIQRGTNDEIEPQEVFLDLLAKKREEKWGVSEKKFEIPVSKKALAGLFIFFGIIVFGFLCKIFQFQIIDRNDFLAEAQSNKFIINSLKAARGVIYDEKGEQLVYNIPSFDLIVDKNSLPKDGAEKEKLLENLSAILKINTNELAEKINSENEILISENLDRQTLILLETKISELPGVEIKENFLREYKEGLIFSHIIGYLGRISAEEYKSEPKYYESSDYIGKMGLEKTYENYLRRDPGELRTEKDAKGQIISKEIISQPEPGKSLVLWLDADLQRKLQEEMQKILNEIGSKRAAAVALNPKTGGVMALVSLPSFDNNLFSQPNSEDLSKIFNDPQKPLYNRAISGLYPVGSTLKPIVAVGALEENIISPEKKLYCEGKIVIPNIYNPELSTDKNDWRAHGWEDMRKAIAESCDVYFYTIGGGFKEQKGLGPAGLKKYLEIFGWNSKTGIDLPSESIGFIPSPSWKKEIKKVNWWDGDTYNLAIGQGDILTTPIEVANAFVAIANNGTIYQPTLVKEIINSDKNIVQTFDPKILKTNFVNSDYLKIAREGMRQAVTGENSPYASSTLLNSLPVSAAAKTGTAQTSRDNYYHNWVTVFAPYDDPQIVLTIVIEDVEGARAAALPVAKETLNWYFSEKQ